jgi:hypothetical protein
MAFDIAQAGSRYRRMPSALSVFSSARNLPTWFNPVTLLPTLTGLPVVVENAVKCNPPWNQAGLTVPRSRKILTV